MACVCFFAVQPCIKVPPHKQHASRLLSQIYLLAVRWNIATWVFLLLQLSRLNIPGCIDISDCLSILCTPWAWIKSSLGSVTMTKFQP